MKTKKVLLIPTALITMAIMSSCNKLHVHDYSGPYFHNETEHWQVCSKCQEKINVETHSFNQITDTCLACDYKDPICVVGENNHMTALTAHGKTKYEVNVTAGVKFIDNYVFKGSKVNRVNLTKDIVGIYKDAFTDSEVNVIHTEEELVNWVEYNGIYYKDDILRNYQAMIDGKCFETLEEAFKSVESDNVTITILKENISIGQPVSINHKITLESYQPTSKLNANFNIGPNGWLKIPSTITYDGHTKLLLADAEEMCGDKKQPVYTTGSLVFVKKSEKPENVQVSYVKDFSEEENLKPVYGHKQIVNELIVNPCDYFIYGTFVMGKDFKTIYGLTAFAKNISNLTITKLIENDDSIINIASNGFNTLGRLDIDIGIKYITLRGQFQKGSFHYLTIDDNIGSLGECAFTTRVSHDASPEFRKMIALLTSPLYTVKLGKNVSSIGKKCFEDCGSLEKIEGGEGLKNIGELAFNACSNLKEVDFSQALGLENITKDAFKDDLELKSVKLPVDGWNIDGHGYLPTDMTAECTAHYLVNLYSNVNWKRTLGGKICLYNPNDKDADGRYNKVKYYPSLYDALSKAEHGNHIYLTKDAPSEMKDVIISHQLTFEGASDVTFRFTGNLTIDPESYLILPENIVLETDQVKLRKNNDDSSTDYEKQAGIAIRKSVNSVNSNPKIVYGNLIPARSSEAKIGDAVYDAWGLFNFKTKDGSGDEFKETILGYSKLGQQFTQFTIDHQMIEGEPDKRFIWINDKAFYQIHDCKFEKIIFGDNVIHICNYAFEACYNLKSVVFGKNMRWFGTKCFFTCKNLVDVDFSRDVDLNEFGENSFAECYALEKIVLCKEKNLPLYGIKDRAFEKTNLQVFDLGPSYHGWKHNGTDISDDITQNPNAFADYLRNKYPTHNFTR